MKDSQWINMFALGGSFAYIRSNRPGEGCRTLIQLAGYNFRPGCFVFGLEAHFSGSG